MAHPYRSAPSRPAGRRTLSDRARWLVALVAGAALVALELLGGAR